jgi:hypothetical protein
LNREKADMTETQQTGNMFLLGSRVGIYQDKAKRIAARFREQITSALELLKRVPTIFLNKVRKEIRWLWRTSVKSR